MIDTHTHILPGIDDGAQTVDESLRMLRRSYIQGVKTVVLTPHFYPDTESVESFLNRRAAAFDRLREAVAGERVPKLVLGAEVAWCYGLERMENIRELTMGASEYLLLELPYMAWTGEQLDCVRSLVTDSVVTPVIAHVERGLHLQRHGQFPALQELQIPMQLSAGAFRQLFGKKRALRLLSSGRWMIGSDCHNMKNRSPCMDDAARYLKEHVQNPEQFLHWEFEPAACGGHKE